MYPVRTVISALAMALGFTSSAFATAFSFTPIDVPGSLGTAAQDINNAGDIVGVFSAAPPAPVKEGLNKRAEAWIWTWGFAHSRRDRAIWAALMPHCNVLQGLPG